jgi:hypothetical protein
MLFKALFIKFAASLSMTFVLCEEFEDTKGVIRIRIFTVLERVGIKIIIK